MLNATIARDFVDALGQFSAYRTNIYDERGYLVYSTRRTGMGAASRRAAHVISTTTADERTLDDGTQSVALPIEQDGQTIGCIELIGHGSDIHAVAAALKMSFEIRLKFEAMETARKKEMDKSEELLRKLLGSQEGPKRSGEYMELAGFSADVDRRMLLLESSSSGFLEHFSSVNITYDSEQDIAANIDGEIVILKDVTGADADAGIRGYLEGYVAHLRENTPFVGRVFAEAQRCTGGDVRRSFQNLSWLRTNADWLAPTDDTLFFSDYLSEYFMSMVPESVYADMFAGVTQLSGMDATEFIKLADALARSNFNLVKASNELFVHKNTLVYRLNKYRRMLAINPMSSRSDRDFMRYLSFYLKQELHKDGNDERH